jgi:hypothetical protein
MSVAHRRDANSRLACGDFNAAIRCAEEMHVVEAEQEKWRQDNVFRVSISRNSALPNPLRLGTAKNLFKDLKGRGRRRGSCNASRAPLDG